MAEPSALDPAGSGSALHFTRTPPVRRTFTLPFWEATRERKLVIQFCVETQKYQWPPSPTSRFTGRRTLEWREVSGRGTVFSHTVTRIAPGDLKGHEPFLLAAVALDENVLMLASLVNCPIDAVRVGLEVRLTWAEVSDGTHILMFEPSQDLAPSG